MANGGFSTRRAGFALLVGMAMAGAAGASAVSREEQASPPPKDTIFARKIIMDSIGSNMDEIETMTSSPAKISMSEAHEHADMISVMLQAFPHLFPPATNQWKPNVARDAATDTFASPNVWTNYSDFYAPGERCLADRARRHPRSDRGRIPDARGEAAHGVRRLPRVLPETGLTARLSTPRRPPCATEVPKQSPTSSSRAGCTSRVYTDPDVFELEMERIFGRAWLFVGHASQIPNPGDYFTTELGRQPVVMTRHRDGSVHVLFNRCTHRGAKVVNERCGHAPRMTCLYHGWTFDTDGTLAGVPIPEGCAADFRKEDFGLGRAPRTGEYRGFVFASLSAHGPSFEDHIGPIKSNIDDLVDRAPEGTLAFDLGMHRYVFDGNWKLQVENVLDSYHVPFGHASTVNKEGVQFARREGDKSGAKVVEADQQKTSQSWKGRRSYIVGNGHGWTSNTALDDGKRVEPGVRCLPAGAGRQGRRERAAHILTPRLHNTLIYPNVSIMGLNIHVRVIKPIAVDRTEINVYPVRLVGAPDAMNFGNLRLLNVTHSAASFVQTDDIEAFVRSQKGLRCTTPEWVDISRGLGAEEPDRELNATRGSAMHEMVVRAQYKAWAGYMREAS